MTVKRIVANIATDRLDAGKAFYGEILGMELAMDHGWIQTYVAPGSAGVQISLASEGGSGTPVPDLSIEVDDLDDVLERMRAAGLPIV